MIYVYSYCNFLVSEVQFTAPGWRAPSEFVPEVEDCACVDVSSFPND